MSGDNLPAVREGGDVALSYELTPDQIAGQVQKIQQVMDKVMKSDVHYGVIPGTGSKPTLLKPGAEKLMLTFRLRPEFVREIDRDGDHLTVTSYCSIYHIATGDCFARNVAGICSSREAKYGSRQGKRKCPACKAEALVRSTKKSAYFCISNEGGCGKRYGFKTAEAKEIDKQETGKVVNPDLPDTWNTVIKMADKRALVAATLMATGASDFFTQDLEDLAPPSPPVAATEDGAAPPEDSPRSASLRADDDGEDDSPPPASERPRKKKKEEPPADEAPEKISAEQQRELIERAKTAGMSESDLRDVVYATAQKTRRAAIGVDQFDAVIAAIDGWSAEGEVLEGEVVDE